MKEIFREISIEEIEGFRIGNAQDAEGGSGCTVIICEKGAVGGVDVRGAGPASRETDLLDPKKACQEVYGVLLSGGSAFGLDAAGGVMRYLEEREIGFDVGIGHVPIVPAACLFDLTVGDSRCRPDAKMGYAACVDSENNRPQSGNFGAGTGATVGKFMEMERAMKSGLGTYALQIGDLKVGAVVAVNSLGDIYDVDTGEQIAGMLTEDGKKAGQYAFSHVEGYWQAEGCFFRQHYHRMCRDQWQAYEGSVRQAGIHVPRRLCFGYKTSAFFSRW